MVLVEALASFPLQELLYILAGMLLNLGALSALLLTRHVKASVLPQMYPSLSEQWAG